MNSLDIKVFRYLDEIANPECSGVSIGSATVTDIFNDLRCAGGKPAVLKSLIRLIKSRKIKKTFKIRGMFTRRIPSFSAPIRRYY